MKRILKIRNLIVSLLIIGIILSVLFYLGVFSAKKTTVSLNNNTADNSNSDITSNDVAQKDESIKPDEVAQDSSAQAPTKIEKTQQLDVTQKVPIQTNDSTKIINRLVNFGYQDATGRKIDTIIIHSSYDATGNDSFSISGIISEFKEYGVSAHYLIGREGSINRLVEDKNIAYHAGVSQVPDGRTGVNSFSIGIEMVNTKTDKFTAEQYSALNSLVGQLKSEYKIKYVLGHNQISPGRKTDPWNFDWSKLN